VRAVELPLARKQRFMRDYIAAVFPYFLNVPRSDVRGTTLRVSAKQERTRRAGGNWS